MVKEDESRSAGSISEFEDDWQYVLSSGDDRFYIFPSLETGRQTDVLEWIKVKQVEKILAEAGLETGNILEYGCGAAGISLYLNQKNYRAHLCDLSKKALQVAHKNQLRHTPRHPVASSAVGNVLKLPYADATFDAVMSFGLLEHFEMTTLQELIQESIRVLKPGGLFIADIIPGIGVLNARTIGVWVSFFGATAVNLLRGNRRKISHVYQDYFDPYFETTFNDREWAEILEKEGLQKVQVDVCRPFPIFALPSGVEKAYAAVIKKNLSLHQRFDRANNPVTRRWGWMYLATGRKEVSRT